MALKPQTNSLVGDLLALGMVRVGTAGELYAPDGSLLELPAGSVPDLDASKITSGVMDEARLPKAAAIADLTDPPTAADFNGLLANLRAAGYLAT